MHGRVIEEERNGAPRIPATQVRHALPHKAEDDVGVQAALQKLEAHNRVAADQHQEVRCLEVEGRPVPRRPRPRQPRPLLEVLLVYGGAVEEEATLLAPRDIRKERAQEVYPDSLVAIRVLEAPLHQRVLVASILESFQIYIETNADSIFMIMHAATNSFIIIFMKY